jgi:type IV secretion system protein VirD4
MSLSMSPSQSQSQTPFDGTFLVFLAVIGFVIGEGVATDHAGQLASLAFGAHHVVPGGIGAGATAFLHLWSHPGDPRLAWGPRARALLPGPVAMWTALAVTELLLLATGIVAFRLVRRVQRWLGLGESTAKVGRAEVERLMGSKAVSRHTAAIYGDHAVAAHEPVGLGTDVATGVRLYARSEDYILGIGIPRVGKGEGFVIPAVLRHKGPAVVTATRDDTFKDTAGAREKRGKVFVFDPQDLVKAEKLRWNPVNGCEDPQKAILRARGFAGFAGVGPAMDGGGAYWEQVAASIIRTYLHAAALGGLGVKDLLDWSRRPAAAEPGRILSRNDDAAPGWEDDLGSSADVEPRHRDSIWATVRRAFDCFADPKVLEATRVDHDTFDPSAFLADNGTIYLMGSPGAQQSVAPIVAALIEDIVDTARRQAAKSERHRLEAGLMLMLDECANIAPLGDLPKLVAELGGLGITTTVILQSVAAARNIWGEAGERALRDLANITLVWGGQKDGAFLEEISRLAGEEDVQVETTSIGPSGKVSSWTARRLPVLPTWDIANLAPDHAVIVSPHLRPRITRLPSWRDVPELSDQVKSSRTTVAAGANRV